MENKNKSKNIDYFFAYSWIFFSLALSVYVLSYYGVFKINANASISGDAVAGEPEVYLKDIQKSQIILKIENNGNEDYQIKKIDAEGCNEALVNRKLEPGLDFLVTIQCNDEIDALNFKGSVLVTYSLDNYEPEYKTEKIVFS